MLPHHPVYGDYYIWWNQGGKETLASYTRDITEDPKDRALIGIKDAMPEKHLDFLLDLDVHYENDKYFFVHGGINPKLSIEENKEKTTRYDMIWMREPFISSKRKWKKKVIFGHTVDYDGRYRKDGRVITPISMSNKIGIDTFLHNRGRLTAVILPDEKIVQTPFTKNALRK